ENEDLNPAPTKTVYVPGMLAACFPPQGTNLGAKVSGFVRSGGISCTSTKTFEVQHKRKDCLLLSNILLPDRCIQVTTERSSKEETRLFVIIRTELTLFLLHAAVAAQEDRQQHARRHIYKQRTVTQPTTVCFAHIQDGY
ncbi:unnamed protein product, partial [Ectocarpus sp. 8 AP-2014]